VGLVAASSLILAAIAASPVAAANRQHSLRGARSTMRTTVARTLPRRAVEHRAESACTAQVCG
jgi:hypothetical protein